MLYGVVCTRFKKKCFGCAVPDPYLLLFCSCLESGLNIFLFPWRIGWWCDGQASCFSCFWFKRKRFLIVHPTSNQWQDMKSADCHHFVVHMLFKRAHKICLPCNKSYGSHDSVHCFDIYCCEKPLMGQIRENPRPVTNKQPIPSSLIKKELQKNWFWINSTGYKRPQVGIDSAGKHSWVNFCLGGGGGNWNKILGEIAVNV